MSKVRFTGWHMALVVVTLVVSGIWFGTGPL